MGAAATTYSSQGAVTAVTNASAVANCLVYSVNATPAAACLQCMNGFLPTAPAAASVSLTTCTATGAIPYCNIYSFSFATPTITCLACSQGYTPSAAGL